MVGFCKRDKELSGFSKQEIHFLTGLATIRFSSSLNLHSRTECKQNMIGVCACFVFSVVIHVETEATAPTSNVSGKTLDEQQISGRLDTNMRHE
jgi:hypothetical protein